jgi:hypothetical protein
MAVHGLMPRTADLVCSGQTQATGKFGRLFPYLDLLRVEEESLRELASKMLESVGGTADNPDVPAAYTYLGQFIDHDITFDTTSLEETRVDPPALTNYRSARFDLDSVYGAGPDAQPHLYQRSNPDLFEIGCAKVFKTVDNSNDIVPDIGIQADLPRGRNRFALIGDPRNDENLIVAQLHLAFLFFHNKIVELLQGQAPKGTSVFIEARDLAIRHYQWVLLHDFLPRIVGDEMIKTVLQERSFLARTQQQFMPVEFSAAAYRFGHSTLRPQYNINEIFSKATLQELFEFSGGTSRAADVPIPKIWVVEWFRLLNTQPALQNTLSRRIDPYLADELAALPLPGGNMRSLAEMNLIRGNMLSLPTGQSIAEFLGYKPLTPEEIGQGPDGAVAAKLDLDRRTPLWYYILKEAKVRAEGHRLGPVGARIVADVFIGLLELDDNSILNRARKWTPTLPSREKGKFYLSDLLQFAGVLADGGLGPSLLTKCDHEVSDDCFSPVKQ